MKIAVTVFVAACIVVSVAPEGRAQNGDEARKGSWEKMKVHGKSLEGNLGGDSPDRDVFVYLPPSYAASPNRRYPIVYFLHGYAAHADRSARGLAGHSMGGYGTVCVSG